MAFSINSRASLYHSSHIMFNNTHAFKVRFSPHDTPSLSAFQRNSAGKQDTLLQGFAQWLLRKSFDSQLIFDLWPYFSSLACWPKWVQGSELSNELDGVHDNHFAKPSTVHEDSGLSGHHLHAPNHKCLLYMYTLCSGAIKSPYKIISSQT